MTSSEMLSQEAHTSELLSLTAVERSYILHIVDVCAGCRSRAAQVLGIDRKTLYRKLRAYGV
jgi:DNA-binding protein Fis